MKFLKRSLALVLTLALLLGLAVPGVGADTTGTETPDGSTSNNAKLSLQAVKYDNSNNVTPVDTVKEGDTFYLRVNFENFPEESGWNISILIKFDTELVTPVPTSKPAYFRNPKDTASKLTVPDGTKDDNRLHDDATGCQYIYYMFVNDGQLGQYDEDSDTTTVLKNGTFGEIQFTAKENLDATSLAVFNLQLEDGTFVGTDYTRTDVQVNNTSIAIDTSSAVVKVVAPNSVSIATGTTEIDPYDATATKGAAYDYKTNYTAKVYDADGAEVDNANIVWSIEDYTGGKLVFSETNKGQLIVKSDIEDGTTAKVKASVTVDGTTYSDTLSIKIKKAASVLTKYKYHLVAVSENGWGTTNDVTHAILSQDGVTDGSCNEITAIDLESGASQRTLTLMKDEELRDQYGAEMSDENEVTTELDAALTNAGCSLAGNSPVIPAGLTASGDFTVKYNGEVIGRITLNITKEDSKATDIQLYYYTDGMGSENPAQIANGSLTLPIPTKASDDGSYAGGESYGVDIYAVVLDQYGDEMTSQGHIKPTNKESSLPSGCTDSSGYGENVLKLNLSNSLLDSSTLTLNASCGGASGTLNVKFATLMFGGGDTFQNKVGNSSAYGKTWSELVNISSPDFQPTLSDNSLSNQFATYQVQYRKQGDTAWTAVTDDNDPIPKVGTYQWRVQYQNKNYTENWNVFTAARGTIAITQANISDDIIVTVADGDYTYTGSQITPEVTVTKKVGDTTTTLEKDKDYTVTYGENINAGTNAGSVTVTSVTSVTDGNETFEVTENFTIAKRQLSLTDPNFSFGFSVNGDTDNDKKVTYDGEKHSPTLAVTYNGRTLTFTSDIDGYCKQGATECSWNEADGGDNQYFINAGTLDVYVSGLDQNFTGEVKIGSYEIVKADQAPLTDLALTPRYGSASTELQISYTNSLNYTLSVKQNGETAEDVTYTVESIEGADGDTGEATLNGNVLTTTHIGQIKITATKKGNENYNDRTDSFTVTIIAGRIGIPNTNTQKTYNGKQQYFAGAITDITISGTNYGTNVGSYPVTRTLDNYPNMVWGTPNDSTNTGNYELNKNDPSKVTITYTITPAGAKMLDEQQATVLYSDTSVKTFSAATIAGMLDTNSGTTAAITNVEVTDTDGILATMGEGTDKYAIGENGANVTYKLTDGLTADDEDKTATLTITGTSNNYQGFTLTLTVKVLNKETVDVTYAGGTATYTGSAIAVEKFQTAILPTDFTAAGTGNWTYTIYKGTSADAENKVYSMVNAGTYFVVANYEDDQYAGSASATFTVEPAEISVKSADVVKTYNTDTSAGDAVISNLTFNLPEGTTPPNAADYSAGGTYFDDSDVGTGKTVYFYVKLTDTVNAKNYELTGEVVSDSVKVTLNTGVINPKAITPAVADIEPKEYNGYAITPEPAVTCTGVVTETAITTLVKNRDYTLTYSNNTDAGTASVTITQKAGGNYTFEPVTKTFTINPKTVDVPTAKTGLVFDGTVKTGVEAVPGAAYTLTGNTGTNADSYTAVATLTDTINYKWLDGTNAPKEIEWSIVKAEAPANLINQSVTYRYDETGLKTVNLTGIPADAGTVTCSITKIEQTILIGSAMLEGTTGVTNNGEVSFTLAGMEQYQNGLTVEIDVQVVMNNYETKTVTLTITLTDAYTPTIVSTGSVTKTYDGAAINLNTISFASASAVGEDSTPLTGTWSVVAGTARKDSTEGTAVADTEIVNAGTYYVTVKFTPDNTDYKSVTGDLKITITKATPTLNAETDDDGKVIYDDEAETLNDVLSASDFTPAGGTLVWKQNGTTISGETALADIEDVEDITWSYTPADETNYNTVSGGIVEEESSKGWIIGALGGLFGGSHSPLDDFSDLSRSAWYADAVEYCVEHDLMSGVGDGKFDPNGSMTRAMVWTVLGRLSGETFNGTGANWYAEAQSWAMANGISDGTNPNGTVTREELVTMLWRLNGCPAADVSLLNNYNDGASVSDWAKTAMAWAVSVQLVEGSNWNLTPSATALRCQVAAIFMRYHRYC